MSAQFKLAPNFERNLIRKVDIGIGNAVADLEQEVVSQISVMYPPASEPFTPPHMRTGGLARSVFHHRARSMDWIYGYKHVLQARPKSNRRKLGIWLELGTRNMAPRPVLMQTLTNEGPKALRRHLSGIL